MTALVKAWIFLVILTLAAMWAGTAQGRLLPAVIQTGIIIAVSILKASTILSYFLGLRSASTSWRMLFSIYLVVLGGAIFSAYAVGCSLASSHCVLSSIGAIHD